MSSRTLCLSGGVLLASPNGTAVDVLIEGPSIVEIGPAGTLTAASIVDVAGSWILPGLVDAHVHPIHAETFQSVGELAAHSGVTTVLHHLYPEKDERLMEAVIRGRQQAGSGASDFGFHVRITPDRIVRNSPQSDGFSFVEELQQLVASSEVVSVKSFLAHSDPSVVVGMNELARIMFGARIADIPVVVHAEPGEVIRELEELIGSPRSLEELSKLRSADLEAATVSMAAAAALTLDARLYIAHISSALVANSARHARERGARIKGETCVHYLYLDVDCGLGSLARVTPPLRDSGSVHALRELTSDSGSAIDVLASDHCGYLAKQKPEHDFEHAGNGLPGVNSLLPMMINSLIEDEWFSAEALIRLCCEGPATTFGLFNKGKVAPGYDADLVVIDPTGTTTISNTPLRSAFAETPYQDRRLKGSISHVLRRGEFVIRDRAASGSSEGAPISREAPRW